eukprot:TRINITY_DN24438_c0_g1_i1.p1 TRINITY_DN24438_c0_g1~~TRINITY_DN24438_c0_g1_i1.p1  ORF type:complete len:447 (+),score=30.43 TRINITY_DN24438_c0_g1_i1:41-1381(+)
MPPWTFVILTWVLGVGGAGECLYTDLTVPSGALSLDRRCAVGGLVEDGGHCPFSIEGYECSSALCLKGTWAGAVVCTLVEPRGGYSVPVEVTFEPGQTAENLSRSIATYMGLAPIEIGIGTTSTANTYSILFRGGDCATLNKTKSVCGVMQTCIDTDGLPNAVFTCVCDPPLQGTDGASTHAVCGLASPATDCNSVPCLSPSVCSDGDGKIDGNFSCSQPRLDSVSSNLSPAELKDIFVSRTACCPSDCFSSQIVKSDICAGLKISPSHRYPCKEHSNRVKCETQACFWSAVTSLCSVSEVKPASNSDDDDGLPWYGVLLIVLLGLACVALVCVVIVGMYVREKPEWQVRDPEVEVQLLPKRDERLLTPPQPPPQTVRPQVVEARPVEEFSPLPDDEQQTTFDSLRPLPDFEPSATPSCIPGPLAASSSPSPRRYYEGSQVPDAWR